MSAFLWNDELITRAQACKPAKCSRRLAQGASMIGVCRVRRSPGDEHFEFSDAAHYSLFDNLRLQRFRVAKRQA